MLQVRHLIVRSALLIAPTLVLVIALALPSIGHAGDDGVIIDVKGAKRSAYPLAIPLGVNSDGTMAKEVQSVATFDLKVAGWFKVLDPASFLADLDAEKLSIEPQKWKDVGAYGVVKYRVTSTGKSLEIEFNLFEVSKGTTPSLSRTYKGSKDDLRGFVHAWCNEVVKYYTGEDGFFGSKLAFVTKKKGQSTIMAMDFDGNGVYSVTRNKSINMLPDFSPGGGQIAFTSYMRNNPDLYVVGAGGGRPKRIASYKGMNTGAAWSPDGSKLAVTLSKDGNPEIYILSAKDGAVLKRITSDKAIDTSPSWSPDGSELAFVSDREGGPQIYVVSSSGGTPKRVSKNGSYNTTPTWSPRKGSRMLAYTTRDGGHFDIVTLDLDTGTMVRITQDEGSNEEPSFAPNGRAIAFARSGGGGSGVYVANADGTGKAVKVWSGSATGVDWGPTPAP
ncbi:MAG: Tol-Pal system beta propeller repeat protein TolB [Myxococcales bacterium]|nr:Tol-Pal system beta propeller repeat protein TolB [Myxococcales bacterium]